MADDDDRRDEEQEHGGSEQEDSGGQEDDERSGDESEHADEAAAGEDSGDDSDAEDSDSDDSDVENSEADDSESDDSESDDSDDSDDDERTPSPSLSAKEMTVAAIEALGDLTGHEPEAATGLTWDGESWLVTVDVLELRRVPNTTDLLATYVVQLDDDGNLSGYKRTRRFTRGQAEEA